jgi:histone-lysine N-methyltransferase SETMAR
MMTSLQHLQRYSEGGERFLDLIVTGDETWILNFTPESKQQSMVWKHPGLPSKKKFRRTPSVGKLMVTVFWDRRGPLLLHFMLRDATIDACSYCGTIARLRASIRKKRLGILVDDVLLLHDNASPHVANRTAGRLQSFGWVIMEHAPYSTDLAPSNYHVFGPLKKFLAGHRFISDNDAKTAVRRWFRTQPAEFYNSGISKLVVR